MSENDKELVFVYRNHWGTSTMGLVVDRNSKTVTLYRGLNCCTGKYTTQKFIKFLFSVFAENPLYTVIKK